MRSSQRKIPEIAKALKEVGREVDTVFSVAMFMAGGRSGDFPTLDYFRALGFDVSP